MTQADAEVELRSDGGSAESRGRKRADSAMLQSKGNFFGLGIAPGILGVLDAMKFTVPTPIQKAAIPIAIEGKDIIGVAQTGTGKTLAFGIPMIQRLAKSKSRGLVLVPTRELALQIYEDLAKFTRLFKLKAAVVIGGEQMARQIRQLKERPHIIIATPGRLNDHIERRQVRLSDVGILVLDEADRMLDMGFLPQIERIFKIIPRTRQTMLFSATMEPGVMKIAASHMHLPVSTEIAPSGSTPDLVAQEIIFVMKDQKTQMLGEILAQYTGSVLLFVRTKRGADRVARQLRGMGHTAAEIHADRSLQQRKKALSGFKTGEHRILVATDVAARGLDIKDIELVINYDLPDDIGNYVHRIGRTGRAGKKGHAIAFATPDQKGDVKAIERFMSTVIPVSRHSKVPAWMLGSEPKAALPKPAFGRSPRKTPSRFSPRSRRR